MWEKINPMFVENCIWSQVEKSKVQLFEEISGPSDDIERQNLFEDLTIKSARKIQLRMEQSHSDSPNKLFSIIGKAARMDQIQIPVAKFLNINKITWNELRSMVKNIDATKIGHSSFVGLSHLAPTKEEISAINEYSGRIDNLD